MRRLHKLILIAIVGLLACPGVPAQDQKSEREAVVKSFKQYIKDYMDSYKTDKRERVQEFGAGWAKEYFAPDSNYGIDVKATDSLISPYSGVCEFTIMRRWTAYHVTKEDAEKDNNFINAQSVKHKHTYAFQEGRWVPSGRQYHSDFPYKWYDCDLCQKTGEPLVFDVMGCWEPDAKHPVIECKGQ
jgi:type II secretory pathway pseudopilin PulG